MRPRTQAGMTLLEVLIAVTLVSLLAVGMLFAIQAGLTAMEASARRMSANRRATGAQRILAAEVAGFLPVMANCGATPGSDGGEPAPFFEGKPGVMRFVSTYSLQGASRGMPQIVVLFVIAGENGRGVRLVLNESPYNGPVGAGFECLLAAPDPMTRQNILRFPQPQATPRSFVVADKLAGCQFAFRMAPSNEPERWVPVWTRQDLWPVAVRIDMAPLEVDPSRVAPMTFTGRIRPNRFPGELFAY